MCIYIILYYIYIYYIYIIYILYIYIYIESLGGLFDNKMPCYFNLFYLCIPPKKMRQRQTNPNKLMTWIISKHIKATTSPPGPTHFANLEPRQLPVQRGFCGTSFSWPANMGEMKKKGQRPGRKSVSVQTMTESYLTNHHNIIHKLSFKII